jgi:hypothetical protein
VYIYIVLALVALSLAPPPCIQSTDTTFAPDEPLQLRNSQRLESSFMASLVVCIEEKDKVARGFVGEKRI